MIIKYKHFIENKDSNLIEESATKNEIISFLQDFGFLLSMNLSHVSSYSIDDQSKLELSSMMKNCRNKIINGKDYFEILKDMNTIIINPKFLSSLLLQIKKLIEYIEPRIIKFVKECETKDKWIEKIKRLKTTYLNIIS